MHLKVDNPRPVSNLWVPCMTQLGLLLPHNSHSFKASVIVVRASEQGLSDPTSYCHLSTEDY